MFRLRRLSDIQYKIRFIYKKIVSYFQFYDLKYVFFLISRPYFVFNCTKNILITKLFMSHVEVKRNCQAFKDGEYDGQKQKCF